MRILLSILFLFAMFGTQGALAGNDLKPWTGGPAPQLALRDLAGHPVKLSDFKGKVVVVNFWATWCKPCLNEIPDLSKVYSKYKDKGVVFLGVMTDNPDDSALLNFQSDHEISYPVVRGNSDILVAFQYPESLPTTFVFDRGGKQVFSRVGGVRESALAQVLEPLIAQHD